MSFSPLPEQFSNLLNQLKSYTNPRILDLGSGNGDFSKLLAGYGLPVWGLDCLPKSAGVVAQLRGDALNPPLLKGSLDCILAGNLVRHLLVQDREGAFLQTWLELLRPGGSLFLFEDEPCSNHSAQENYKDLQFFLAQLMPSVRGPLFSLSEMKRQAPGWTPDQKWITGLVENELKPDQKAVCTMLSAGFADSSPTGPAGRLISNIEQYGLDYGSYWWAHARKA